MQAFLRICTIISIIIASIKLSLIGNLTPGTVVFIILCSILVMVGNRTLYIITTAAAALVLFLKVYAGNSYEQAALLQSVLTLVIICFGFYIMFKGLLGSKKTRKH